MGVEQSPVSIVLTDAEGNIQYVNPQFTEISGYTLEEVVGKNPSITSSGNTARHVYRELWETIKAGDTWTGEFQNRSKSGELYWESSKIKPMKTVAKTLRKKRELLLNWFRAKGEISAGIVEGFNIVCPPKRSGNSYVVLDRRAAMGSESRWNC